MMKVYVVETSNCDGGASVEGIYTTEREAQDLIDAGCGEYIDEREVDYPTKKTGFPWTICMKRNGSISNSYLFAHSYPSVKIYNPWGRRESVMDIVVLADSEQHAIKMANEKRIQLIANNEWPEDDH